MFTTETIRAHELVAEYVGERVKLKEAERRAAKYRQGKVAVSVRQGREQGMGAGFCHRTGTGTQCWKAFYVGLVCFSVVRCSGVLLLSSLSCCTKALLSDRILVPYFDILTTTVRATFLFSSHVVWGSPRVFSYRVIRTSWHMRR